MLATIGYVLSGAIGLAIVFIGARFLLAPMSAASAYGVAVPSQAGWNAYLEVKGVRDIASGLFVAVLIAHGSAHVLGWFMLAASFIPLADTLIVVRHGGSKVLAVGVHGGTALVMLLTAALLLMS
jgi:hypothetical protein